MVTLRSEREIGHLRAAGLIVAEVFEAVAGIIRPGVTTLDINRTVEKVLAKYGAEALFKGYRGFPASSCVSVNEEVVHGIPSRSRRLREGDIVSVDVGVRYDGYCGDAAVTFPVGRIEDRVAALCAACRHALELAVQCLYPGRRLSNLGRTVQGYAQSKGYSVVKKFVGHGIGTELHEPPQVPNYVDSDILSKDLLLKPGMVLAVEPMLNEGADNVSELQDGWTVVTEDRLLSTHYEKTVAVGSGGPMILTPWDENIDREVFSPNIGGFPEQER